MTGAMKASHDADWMRIEAAQTSFFDAPTRLFHLRARRSGLPFEALHVYRAGAASMQVRVLSVFDIVDAKGTEMSRSETVTMLDDMCLLAPSTLLDADLAWSTIDPHTVGVTYRNAGITVSARLFFDASGDLVDFVSDDRSQSSDGKTFTRLRWSTPIRAYGDFHGLRLPSAADAIWIEPSGAFPYARFVIDAIGDGVDARH
jgi:hypothetical protein